MVGAQLRYVPCLKDIITGSILTGMCLRLCNLCLQHLSPFFVQISSLKLAIWPLVGVSALCLFHLRLCSLIH